MVGLYLDPHGEAIFVKPTQQSDELANSKNIIGSQTQELEREVYVYEQYTSNIYTQ